MITADEIPQGQNINSINQDWLYSRYTTLFNQNLLIWFLFSL